jgi:hypothetical protein
VIGGMWGARKGEIDGGEEARNESINRQIWKRG